MPRKVIWSGSVTAVAHAQGWGVFDSGAHGVEIQRDDEAGIFLCDASALVFVKRQAAAGSQAARRALAYIIQEQREA